MGDLQLGIRITADGKTADMEFNRIRQSLGEVGKSAQSIESNLSSMASVAKSAFAAMGAAFSVKQLIETTDAYTNMNSKLKLATASADEYANAQKSLFAIAQNNKTALNETVSLYSRIAVGMRDMGASQAQVLKVVDSVGKALKVSGASTAEAASVTTQLSQALASGVLRGEEFNAVMENGPRLARAIADGLRVPIGALREMATEGKLTSEQVIRALESQSGALSQEASSMQTTVGQAWQMLENAATSYIGEADQANGVSKDLASTIEVVANNFSAMVDPAAKVMAYIAKVEVGGWLALSDAIASVKTNLMEMIGQQSAGTPNPEVQRLMKLGQGQIPIDELAAKSEKAATTVATHYAKTTKAAKKGASDAEAAFKATIDANVKAAEDAARLYDAQAKTSAMRFDNERKQAEETARLEMKATESQDQKLRIADELRQKQEALIAQETRLKEEQLAKDEAALMARINGVNMEIDAADKYNLKQSERIKLQTELQSLISQQQALPEEKAQIQLESMAKLAEATKQYNDVRVDGETNVREQALRTLEVMSSNLEYAKEMASGLSDAFGDVGTAIGGMTVALAEYAKQQATISIQAAEDIKKDPARKLEIEQEAMQKNARTQIKAYGDITQAAQGFFKKGTKGYEALGGAVKVFRAFEMAQSAMSFAKQLGDMGGMFTAFTQMLTQMGVLSSAETTKTIVENQAKATSEAAVGAAHQGTSGDPYTAFARVAAWIALMAGLGIAISGGGGSSSAAAPVDTTGMGTVKGDPTKKSESIQKSLELLAQNSTNGLSYSADMLDALRNIESALGAASDLVAQKVLPVIGDIISKFSSSGMFSSKDVKEAGFLVNAQSLSKVLSSGLLTGSLAARIDSKTGLLGEFHSGQTLIAKYGNDIAKAFGKIVETIYTSIVKTSESIGIPAAEIEKRMEGLKVGLGKVNLAGKSSEEAAKTIEAAFSAMSDKMAERLLPEFKDFQQNGEGYFQTINRVGEGINRATGELELLGMKAIDFSEISKKQGDVAAEIVRQTLMAQGDLSEGTRKYVSQLTGSSEDLIDAYKKILDITHLMRAGGFGTDTLDRTMINAGGGLDAFSQSLQDFYDNFLSDNQKVASQASILTDAFAKLGFTLPQSKEDFYAIAMGIDRTTDEGKKLFAQFIALSGKFSELTDASKQLSDAQAEAAQKSAEAAQKIQDDLISSLQKNVDSAFSAMQKAYQDLQKVQERFLSYSKTIRAYLEELKGGKSSYLSPEERYKTAQAEFNRISALAVSGNESALAEVTKAGKDFLDASREYNASSTQFQSDLASVTSALEASTKYAETQASIAENQLTVAANTYSALVTLNATTLGVQTAIGTLSSTMATYANAVATLAKTPTVAPPPAPKPTPAPVPIAPTTPGAAFTNSGGSGFLSPGGGPSSQPSTPSLVPSIPGGAAGYNIVASSVKRKYPLNEARDIIDFYYRQLLGRLPESDAVLNEWASQLTTGSATANQIADIFKSSDEYRSLLSKGFIPGFAKGGLASPGLTLVGEQGPELVNFTRPGQVYTASQTQSILAGGDTASKLDGIQAGISAGIRVDQAVGTALIAELQTLNERMAIIESASKLQGAAA